MKNDPATWNSVVAYFLSKYSLNALHDLGFKNYASAFRELGAQLGKDNNYMHMRRDEFDALVSNERRGWANRKPTKEVMALHNVLSAYTYSQMLDICKYIISKKTLPDCLISTDNKAIISQVDSTKFDNKSIVKNSDASICVVKVGEALGLSFCKLNCRGNFYIAKENKTVLLQLSSKCYPITNSLDEYWFSIRPKQIIKLLKGEKSYIAFYLVKDNNNIVINSEFLMSFIGALKTTTKNGETYWHIKIHTDRKNHWILFKPNNIILSIDNAIIIRIPNYTDKRPNKTTDENNFRKKTNMIKLTDTHLKEIKVKKKH